MKIQLTYLFAILFVFVGCDSTKTISSKTNSELNTEQGATDSVSTTTEKPFLIVSFEQTACMGSCPVHKLTILSTGIGNYKGNRNVTLKGDYVSNISADQIQEIIATAKSLNYFDLEDSYTANMTDLPTTIIYINDGIQKKKVIAYGNYPENLKEFITYLYDFSQSVDWQLNE